MDYVAYIAFTKKEQCHYRLSDNGIVASIKNSLS